MLTHWKRPWCWERLKTGGEGEDRGWDSWMASPTQWTWVWVNSGSWWWTGRPGVLRLMGLQRVRHDWAIELNWCKFSSAICGSALCAMWKFSSLTSEHAPPALEGGVLTTGPLEKFLDYSLIQLCFHLSFLLLMGIFLSWPFSPAPSLCLNHLFILLKPEGRIQTQVLIWTFLPAILVL